MSTRTGAGKARGRIRLIALSVAIATVLPVVLATAAMAVTTTATSVPYHSQPTFTCNTNGEVWAELPSDVRSPYASGESVYFKASLYRWSNGAWRAYDTSRTWAKGYATPNGLIPIYSSYKWMQGSSLAQYAFRGLPHGYYAVTTQFYWGTLKVYSPVEWATSPYSTGYYCAI